MLRTVFRLQMLKPLTGDVNHATEVTLYACYLRLYLCYKVISLLLGELKYALHLYLHEAQYIILGHLTHQLRVERCQPLINMLTGGIHGGSVLIFLILIYTLLYEDTLQRTEEQLLQQFIASYLQFPTQQLHRLVCTAAQHIADAKELWLTVFYDAAVWRYAYLTVGEGIEGVEGLV